MVTALRVANCVASIPGSVRLLGQVSLGFNIKPHIRPVGVSASEDVLNALQTHYCSDIGAYEHLVGDICEDEEEAVHPQADAGRAAAESEHPLGIILPVPWSLH